MSDLETENEKSEEVEAEEVETNDEQEQEEAESDKEDSSESEEKVEEEPPKEEDFKEKYYYLAAEMENMRKRFMREKESLLKYGNERVLSGLIEVVDNLDLTISSIESDEDEKVKNIVTGVDMVRKLFLDVLSKNGLTQIESIGKIFDPNFHEAMSQQAMEGKKDQEIIMECKKGYILNGRLLRASQVIIAKK